MIELKKEFKKGNRTFKQLLKQEYLVIYSVTQPHQDDDGNSEWYEVFRRIVREKDMYHEDEFEKYPNDEAFGTWAWSCSNLKCVRKTLINHFAECDVDAIIAGLKN